MKELKASLKRYLHEMNEVLMPQMVEAGFRVNPINMRENAAAGTAAFCKNRPEIAKVIDTYAFNNLGFDVPVRVFHPNPDKALPIFIYLHGGGTYGWISKCLRSGLSKGC